MENSMTRILILSLLLLFRPTPTWADGTVCKTLKTCQKEAESGNSEAQFRMGSYYDLGLNGVDKNIEKAEYWYRKATNKNHIMANTNLGLLLLKKGRKYPDDQKAGFELILKSAESGDDKAQLLAGMLFSSPSPLPQDFKKALYWYKQSAKQGNYQAQHNIGLLYYRGNGVEKDLEQAKKWSKMAADQGDEKAVEFLKSAFLNVDLGEKTDQNRICDVLKISLIVESFKEKTGYYPYQEAYLNPEDGYRAVPASVNIYRGELPDKYKWPPKGRSGRVFSLDEFETYIGEKMGTITLPTDDRLVDENSYPAFYQYMFDGKAYYVSALLNKSREDVKQVGDLYKYQLSSISAPDFNIKKLSDGKNDCKN